MPEIFLVSFYCVYKFPNSVKCLGAPFRWSTCTQRVCNRIHHLVLSIYLLCVIFSQLEKSLHDIYSFFSLWGVSGNGLIVRMIQPGCAHIMYRGCTYSSFSARQIAMFCSALRQAITIWWLASRYLGRQTIIGNGSTANRYSWLYCEGKFLFQLRLQDTKT